VIFVPSDVTLIYLVQSAEIIISVCYHAMLNPVKQFRSNIGKIGVFNFTIKFWFGARVEILSRTITSLLYF